MAILIHWFVGAEQLISALKSENERLKSQVNDLSATNANSSNRRDSSVSVASTTSSVASTSLDGQSLARQVDLYRELSGLDLEVVGQFAWKCSLSGRLGTLRFDLCFNEASEHFEYTPNIQQHDSSSSIANVLPAYLLEEISFGPDQLQLFFWRAMNFLMQNSSSSSD